MKRGQGAFEYLLLLAGVISISLIAFFLMRGTASGGGKGVEFANCKSQLIAVNSCYEFNGTWKSDPLTPRKVAEYGIKAECTKDGSGALFGTPWDVAGTDDEFTCGDVAPN